MKQEKEILKKVIALALLRWHGRMEPEIVRKVNNLTQVVFYSWPQVMSELEALNRNLDWSTVWSSLLQLTVDQLYALLDKEDLSVEDITTAGAAKAIERLWNDE
jgi:hypothetical protein